LKIAICFSGQPRIMIDGIMDNINRNIIESNNCDIFTYASKDDGKFSNSYKMLSDILKNFNCISTKFKDDFFLDFEDRPMFSDISNRYKKEEVSGKVKIQGILQQMFYIEECNKLREIYESENNFKYDWVIRCRFDIAFYDKLNLDNYSNEPNKVYLRKRKIGRSKFDDCFAFGDSASMSIYSNRFSYLTELNEKSTNAIFSTETLMMYVLNKYGIEVVTENLPGFDRVDKFIEW